MSSSQGTSSWAATLVVTAAVSAAVHACGLALAARLEPRRPQQQPVEVEFEAVEAPPPEPPRQEPPAPPPAPEPPAPRRVSMAKLPPPPPDVKAPPPPPAETPPPDARPAAKAVPLTGLSLSSTVQSGGFAVPAGNTLYGKAPEVAPDPKKVEPYAAEGTAPPPPAISRQPRLLDRPEFPYPPDAKRAGVAGEVKLLLHIDRQGRVVSARVLADPGAGLGEAARAGALQLRFSPGLLDGEPVDVPDLILTYRFILE